MRKNAVILPLSAAILGLCGFFLRSFEVRSIYDPTTGLFLRHTAVTTALVLLSVVVFVYCILTCVSIGKKYTASEEFSEAFYQKTPLYLVISVILGLGWLVLSVDYLINQINQSPSFPVIDVVFMILSALSAVAIIVLARGAKMRKSGGGMLVWSVIPPIFLCLWLILTYKDHASSPDLLMYAFTYLAVAFSTLSFYYTAGYVYGKTAAGRTVLSYMMTIFLSIVILADTFTPRYIRLLFVVILVYHAINAVVLIRNLQKREMQS